MKTLPLLSKWVALMILTLASLGAHADDIDIYQGTPGGAAPNVLIIVDNTSSNNASYPSYCPASYNLPNNGKLLDMVYCSVYGALEGIKSQPALYGKLNIGLMSGGSGSNKGGQMYYPKASPYNLPSMTGPGIANFQSIIAAGIPTADGNAKLDGDMQEAWAWLTGTTGPRSGTAYNTSQIGAIACQKTFIILIGAAFKQGRPDAGIGFTNATDLANAGATAAQQVQISTANLGINTGDDNAWIDEWARFLNQKLNVVTYTIAAGGTSGTAPDYNQILLSTANQGGGKAFVGGDYASMVKSLTQIFNEVQATNSVFASPTLPVSANTQGTYLNQIYMGMFRPDPNGYPRWMGNLKQYQIALQNGTPVLADANGVAALSSAGTGFITPGASSFWSSKNTTTLPDLKGGFWLNAIAQQGGNDGYDAPDGQIVEKGGVGQQIRLKYLTDSYIGAAPTTSRNLYTCIGSNCPSNTPATPPTPLNTMPFNIGNTNLTTTAFQIPSGSPITSANLPNFINWVRGEDTSAQVPDTVAGPESSAPPDPSITIRGSVHGDVLHSRPAVVNYGGSIGVVAFYGANDGVFRAVNGNQTSSITMAGGGSVPAGGELWGFVPPELYPGLQQLYQNSPALHLGSAQTSPPSASTSGKNYFFDGDTSVYHTTGKTYIFLSARRGGRLLYALDVTDPTNPKFMWKHTNADPGFAELGQTWSQPKVAMVKGNANPVLIFGAGYDPNEDFEPPAADGMGRGIFILDAVTGNLLWRAGPGANASATCVGTPCLLPGMTYAMPADVTLIDRNRDGFVDRLYAADTGGNIWRVDLEPPTAAGLAGTGLPSTWQVTQFAALGGTGTTKRKFFFPPDVVLTNTVDLVSAVTGDREHPLRNQQANGIVNRFYTIQDTKTGMSASGWSTVTDDSSSTANAAPSASPPLFDATSTPYKGSLPGYYVTLLNSGEKGVNAPLTVAGTVYFGTSQPPQPSSTSCTASLGTARGYQVNLLTGTKSSSIFAGGGLVPSPVFAVVDVLVNGKMQETPVLFGGGVGTGPDASSSFGASNPFLSGSMPKKRTYWYRNIDR